MSINEITIQLNDHNCNAKCHLIPCKVNSNCAAKTDEYFNSIIRESETDTLISSFRGRPLIGHKIELPIDSVGVVLVNDTKNSCLKTKKTFKELTYWNWDQKPSKDDSVPQSLKWIQIAKALHCPIKSEDLEKIN